MKNRHLIIKLLIAGCLIAFLAYLFHPDVGQFSLTINGEPVAEPLARLAALPTLLMVILLTALLTDCFFRRRIISLSWRTVLVIIRRLHGSFFLAGIADCFRSNRLHVGTVVKNLAKSLKESV
jgi:hypothetical protein